MWIDAEDSLALLCVKIYADKVISNALTAKAANQTDCIRFLHLRYLYLAAYLLFPSG